MTGHRNRFMGGLKVLVVCLIGYGSAVGQELWKPTGGPPGGRITDIDIDPATGDYYAIINATPNDLIYRSADLGENWVPAGEPPSVTDLTSMCINASGQIFVSSYNSIYRTSDQGVKWDTLTTGITTIINTLFFDYKSEDLFAGTSHGGIFRSEDNGTIWAEVNTGLTNFENLDIWRFYTHTDGRVFVCAWQWSQEGGVFVSIDKGAGWSRINGDISDTNIRGVTVNSTGRIFAITYGSSGYFSDNDGNNWTHITGGLDDFPNDIVVLSNGHIIAGSLQHGVFKSIDNGVNWQTVAFTPGDLAVNELAHDATTSRIIVGCDGSGILIGSLNGNSWQLKNNGIHRTVISDLDYSGRLYASGTGIGIWRFEPELWEWKSLTYDLPSLDVAHVSSRPGQIFTAAFNNGIYRMPETGTSWTKVSDDIPYGQIPFTYLAPDGTIFAQTGTAYHFYRSIDDGNSWTDVFSGEYKDGVRAMIGKTGQGYYFAGTNGNGMLRSMDGTMWTPVNSGLGSLTIRSLALAADQIRVYAATDDGLYKSDNDGDSWEKFTNIPLGGTVVTVAVNSKDHIFIADQNRGVYISKDGGEIWSSFNGGLPVLNIKELILNAENYLYAATEAGGVFRTIRSTTALTVYFTVRMKNEIGFDPAEDAVYLRGNFSGWQSGDPIIMTPLNDDELTYLATWTSNLPDTVLSGIMRGKVIFWYSYYDQSISSEIQEQVSNLTRTVNWNANTDLETPNVWFGNQELFSRDFIKPNYIEYGNSRGVAWGDYDGDDNLDFIVANSGTQNYLYHNEGDGRFVRFAGDPFASNITDAANPVWGDFDNDGDIDLFIANKGGSTGENNLFCRNNGDQTFSKMAGQPLVTDSEISNSAAVADFDHNGFLDILVVNEGQLNALYKNEGNGIYNRISTAPFSVDQGVSKGGSWADYDNDGDQDLFIANAGSDPGGFNFLYENLGDGQFRKVTSGNPVVTDKGISYGGCWGDYNNDGLPDLYVVNGGGQANVLYVNQGGGNFNKAPDTLLICEPSDSRGASWVDFNNDGWLDLLVVNFFDFSDDGYRNILYQNLSDGTFLKIGTGPIFIDSGDKSGHAWADYDRDGDFDLILTDSNGGATILYRNNTENNHWLQVSLEGTMSNRQGIGARVVVKNGNIAQMREIGSENTGQGQDQPIAHFGLGGFENIDSLIVIWPHASTGRQVYSAPAVNQRIHLVEKMPDLPITKLLKPDSLAVDVDLFPEFTWQDAGGSTVAYDLQLSNFSDFREFILNVIDIVGTSHQYPTGGAPLPTATQLFWRVKAKDNQGKGNWSNTWSFRTKRGTSYVQILDVISPEKGATGVALPAALSWIDTSAFVGEKTFDLQVSKSSTFSDTISEATDLASGSATVEGLNYNTTYYWHARMKTTSTIYVWSAPPWSFTTEAGTKPAAPILLNPPNGATDIAEYVLLTWNEVAGGVYRLHISKVAGLSNPVYDFQDLTAPYYYVPDLDPGTMYFWGVNISIGGLESDISPVRSFTTRPATIAIAQNLSFPTKDRRDEFTSQDYILFGLPGDINIALDNPGVFGSGFGVKWMAYWDNGKQTDFYEPFDQIGKFRFLPGRGYWIIVNGPVEVAGISPQNLSVNNLAQAEIDIHEGFNIISNPFTVDVAWSLVREINGLGVTEPLYQYNKGFSQTMTMKPYQGYYFDNTNPSRNKLKIPYFTYLPKTNAGQSTDWQLHIDLSDDVSTDATVVLGVAENAAIGLDAQDYRSPRAPGDILQAYMYRPDWKKGFEYIAGDFRPPIESAEFWDLEIRTPNAGRVVVDVKGISWVPENYAVYLIDKTHGRETNLRLRRDYSFEADMILNDFSLAVGDESEIITKIRELVPAEYVLGQNFPNPFNPETTLPVTVPVRSNISLVIFDILGREIRVIYQGQMSPGRHFVKWDGKDRAGNPASSGIYFYQMFVDHKKSFSGKMILMR